MEATTIEITDEALNEIAKNGSKYNNILKYYFPKVKLLRYIKELS